MTNDKCATRAVRQGIGLRGPVQVAICALVLNLAVGVYLAIKITWALAPVPEGQAIRPMGLFFEIVVISMLAVAFSLPVAGACAHAGAKRPQAHGLALFTLLCGFIPFAMSMVVLEVMIHLGSLVLAD
jgi:hypothetical protein